MEAGNFFHLKTFLVDCQLAFRIQAFNCMYKRFCVNFVIYCRVLIFEMSSCLGEAYDLRANRFYLFSLLIICITVMDY